MKTFTLFLLLMGQSAWACSLVPPDTNALHNLFRSRIASQLGLTTSSVPSYSITPPKVTFLKPIGADCSGLDAAFHSSAYSFKRSYPNRTCTHRGVAINRSYFLGPASQVSIQDSTTCVGIPIGPSPSLSGSWINRNASTNYITQFTVRSGASQIRVWGKCVPSDCDWGIVTLSPTGSPRTKRAVYRHGSRTRTLYVTLNGDGDEITLRTEERVTGPAGATSSTRLDYFVRR